MARSLATGQSLLIGLVVPDLVQPFFSGIAKGLSASLRKDNYFSIVSCSESDPNLERDEIERILTHSLDCFVLASCQKDTESLLKIGKAGVPLILIDRSFPGFSCNFVGVDDYRIGELAAEHLLAQGYKRIAHIRGPRTSVGNSRAEGYRNTIEKHGLPMRNDYVVGCSEASDSDDEAVGRTTMEKFLTLRPHPDALFCFNDSVAAGAMMKAFEVGMRIPRDMAILGCGNSYFSSRLRVPLSSIDQRAREIGERTAKLIAAIVKMPPSSWPRTEILEPELIVRAST
jgi:LacI family transcriptional regulator